MDINQSKRTDRDNDKHDLQELLDSRLSSEDREVSPRIQELSESNKGFTSNDTQVFIDNQLKKQLTVEQEEDGEKEIEESLQQTENGQINGQHFILLTQNGDKLIFIQNSNSSIQGHLSNLDTPASLCNEEAKEHSREIYQHKTDMDEQEGLQVQMQHKARQQMLLRQLDKLREKHREKKLDDNDDLTISQTNSWKDDKLSNDVDSDLNAKKFNSRKKITYFDSGCTHPKWVLPLNNCLSKAHDYIRRRGERAEQLGRFFPSASQSFEGRCQELRQELLRLELNIERFQNTLEKDLIAVETRMKSFVEDFHLESFASQIEEEDDRESKELSELLIQNSKCNVDVKCYPVPTISGVNSIKLITPSDMTITSTVDHEQVSEFDSDPVPEIRDIICDEPLSEENNLDCNYLEIETTPEPSTNVKTSLEIISPKKTFKRKTPFKTGNISEEDHTIRKRLRCKYPDCLEEFENNITLTSHIQEHIKTMENDEPLEGEDGFHWYQCDVRKCCRLFSTASLLRKHKLLSHFSPNCSLYKCEYPQCGQIFTEFKGLRTHERTSHSDRLFPCPMCPNDYKHKRSLSKHIRKHHPDSPLAKKNSRAVQVINIKSESEKKADEITVDESHLQVTTLEEEVEIVTESSKVIEIVSEQKEQSVQVLPIQIPIHFMPIEATVGSNTSQVSEMIISQVNNDVCTVDKQNDTDSPSNDKKTAKCSKICENENSLREMCLTSPTQIILDPISNNLFQLHFQSNEASPSNEESLANSERPIRSYSKREPLVYGTGRL